MIKVLISSLAALMLFSSPVLAAKTYGSKVCKEPQNTCYTAKRSDSWQSLFPNSQQRDVVKRLNRTNVPLRAGTVIAIPKNLSGLTKMDISPMPKRINPGQGNTVKVNKALLAWGAYDESGRLVNWGPMSGGKNWCADVGRGCKTVAGNFKVYRMQGAGCRSSKYPRPNGGAEMPWCMHFYRGYAMHGSYTVPGYHASHGCVRLFIEDAKWLNQNFVKRGYTRVIVTHK